MSARTGSSRADGEVGGRPPGAIDRDSPVPFYFQLAAILEHDIVTGRWQPGERLPSEPEMVKRFRLARSTVRQALTRLEQGGLIVRRRGEGTFVERGQPRTWRLQSSQGFFQDELVRAGSQVTSQILRCERETLPNWASDLLGLEPDSEGVTLERIRSIDGLVAMYVVNHLPAAQAELVTGIGDPDESLYRRLSERGGLRVSGASRTLEAVTAGDRMAALLAVPPQAALVFIESSAWDRSLVPFDCYRAWVRSDRMKIDIRVAAGAGEGEGEFARESTEPPAPVA